MTNDPFVNQLADLCRTERARAKWVFVPAHAIGLTLGDRLAREGTDWANLRAVTPLDIATRMAAPFLLEQGIDPSEDALGPALVMRLLLDLPEEGAYFRRMATQASMAAALWRTLRELRFAGMRAQDLPEAAFASRDKHRELVALLAAYENHLAGSRLADAPAVFEEALRHRDWCPIGERDVVTELPGTVWAPLVRQFLDALPGRHVQARALALRDVALPARAGRFAAAIERVDPAITTDASRLAFIQGPGEVATPPRRDGSLDIFRAGGRDAEVEEVFRRILASRRSLDEVEVVCAAPAYSMLAWEKAARLGWEVTISSGVPAAFTRPGRLLLRFCDWVASDLASAELRRLLQSGDCAPRGFAALDEEDAGTAAGLGGNGARATGGGEGELSPGQAARLLLKAQATWGRDTYGPSLSRLARKYDRRSQDEEASDDDRGWNARKAAQTRTLAAWVHDVLGSLPAPDAATRQVPLDALAEAAASFLDANASRGSASDAMALLALSESVRSLRTVGPHRCTIAAGLEFLRGCVASLTVGRDRPRPGRLHVSSLADAGFDARPHAFVVGLQEGGVFPSAVEDPVLLDAERARLSEALRSAHDRIDEAVFAALSRIAALGVSSSALCLSYSCRDTREFRDTFPSWIVLQAFRLQQGDASLTYDQLAEAVGDPVSAVPASAGLATTEAGWWLASCASNAAARAGVLGAFPPLERGEKAEAARDSELFTEFDGLVRAAGAALDPCGTDRAVSATTLEKAAKCPFRFFLEQALGVRPIEEPAPDADVWLTPLDKGSELHELFARLMRDIRRLGRAPDMKTDLPRLHGWAAERLAELKGEMPPPSEEVFAREKGEFLDDLQAFLAAECDGRHGGPVVGVEVTFGLPRDEEDEEPLASDEPLVLDLGHGRHLRVHGRIDRINEDTTAGRGKFEVVDYKTGGYWADEWKGAFAGGTRLQHALYGRAAEGLLASRGKTGRVVRSVYAFPSVKGHRRRKEIPAPDAKKLNAVLGDLIEVIGQGAFLTAEDNGRCRWCEFAAACHAEDPAAPRGAESTRAQRKIDADANTVLDAFRRLRTHE
jgi:ATP-dependent helicase/nuclease subunit B